MICGGVGTIYTTNNESGAPYYLGGFLVGGLVCISYTTKRSVCVGCSECNHC